MHTKVAGKDNYYMSFIKGENTDDEPMFKRNKGKEETQVRRSSRNKKKLEEVVNLNTDDSLSCIDLGDTFEDNKISDQSNSEKGNSDIDDINFALDDDNEENSSNKRNSNDKYSDDTNNTSKPKENIKNSVIMDKGKNQINSFSVDNNKNNNKPEKSNTKSVDSDIVITIGQNQILKEDGSIEDEDISINLGTENDEELDFLFDEDRNQNDIKNKNRKDDSGKNENVKLDSNFTNMIPMNNLSAQSIFNSVIGSIENTSKEKKSTYFNIKKVPNIPKNLIQPLDPIDTLNLLSVGENRLGWLQNYNQNASNWNKKSNGIFNVLTKTEINNGNSNFLPNINANIIHNISNVNNINNFHNYSNFNGQNNNANNINILKQQKTYIDENNNKYVLNRNKEINSFMGVENAPKLDDTLNTSGINTEFPNDNTLKINQMINPSQILQSQMQPIYNTNMNNIPNKPLMDLPIITNVPQINNASKLNANFFNAFNKFHQNNSRRSKRTKNKVPLKFSALSNILQKNNVEEITKSNKPEVIELESSDENDNTKDKKKSKKNDENFSSDSNNKRKKHRPNNFRDNAIDYLNKYNFRNRKEKNEDKDEDEESNNGLNYFIPSLGLGSNKKKIMNELSKKDNKKHQSNLNKYIKKKSSQGWFAFFKRKKENPEEKLARLLSDDFIDKNKDELLGPQMSLRNSHKHSNKKIKSMANLSKYAKRKLKRKMLLDYDYSNPNKDKQAPHLSNIQFNKNIQHVLTDLHNLYDDLSGNKRKIDLDIGVNGEKLIEKYNKSEFKDQDILMNNKFDNNSGNIDEKLEKIELKFKKDVSPRSTIGKKTKKVISAFDDLVEIENINLYMESFKKGKSHNYLKSPMNIDDCDINIDLRSPIENRDEYNKIKNSNPEIKENEKILEQMPFLIPESKKDSNVINLEDYKFCSHYNSNLTTMMELFVYSTSENQFYCENQYCKIISSMVKLICDADLLVHDKEQTQLKITNRASLIFTNQMMKDIFSIFKGKKQTEKTDSFIIYCSKKYTSEMDELGLNIYDFSPVLISDYSDNIKILEFLVKASLEWKEINLNKFTFDEESEISELGKKNKKKKKTTDKISRMEKENNFNKSNNNIDNNSELLGRKRENNNYKNYENNDNVSTNSNLSKKINNLDLELASDNKNNNTNNDYNKMQDPYSAYQLLKEKSKNNKYKDEDNYDSSSLSDIDDIKSNSSMDSEDTPSDLE